MFEMLVDLRNVQVMEGGAIHVRASNFSFFLYHDELHEPGTGVLNAQRRILEALHSRRIEYREFLGLTRTDAPSNLTAFWRP